MFAGMSRVGLLLVMLLCASRTAAVHGNRAIARATAKVGADSTADDGDAAPEQFEFFSPKFNLSFPRHNPAANPANDSFCTELGEAVNGSVGLVLGEGSDPLAATFTGREYCADYAPSRRMLELEVNVQLPGDTTLHYPLCGDVSLELDRSTVDKGIKLTLVGKVPSGTFVDVRVNPLDLEWTATMTADNGGATLRWGDESLAEKMPGGWLDFKVDMDLESGDGGLHAKSVVLTPLYDIILRPPEEARVALEYIPGSQLAADELMERYIRINGEGTVLPLNEMCTLYDAERLSIASWNVPFAFNVITEFSGAMDIELALNRSGDVFGKVTATLADIAIGAVTLADVKVSADLAYSPIHGFKVRFCLSRVRLKKSGSPGGALRLRNASFLLLLPAFSCAPLPFLVFLLFLAFFNQSNAARMSAWLSIAGRLVLSPAR